MHPILASDVYAEEKGDGKGKLGGRGERERERKAKAGKKGVTFEQKKKKKWALELTFYGTFSLGECLFHFAEDRSSCCSGILPSFSPAVG